MWFCHFCWNFQFRWKLAHFFCVKIFTYYFLEEIQYTHRYLVLWPFNGFIYTVGTGSLLATTGLHQLQPHQFCNFGWNSRFRWKWSYFIGAIIQKYLHSFFPNRDSRSDYGSNIALFPSYVREERYHAMYFFLPSLQS